MTTSQAVQALRTERYYQRAQVSENPCVVCGKEVQPGADTIDLDDDGSFPIGADCARKVRKAMAA